MLFCQFAMATDSIGNPRAEIDAIDVEILELLNRRAAIALRVGAAKTDRNAALCDPERENEVITRLRTENQGPFDSQSIANIFQRIIDESLGLQQRTYKRNETETATDVEIAPKQSRVGFLGERGTFSETAAIGILGEDQQYISYPTFEDLYAGVENGETDLIISPLENSLVGSIHRCYDLLMNSRLSIAAETILPVSHFLIGCEAATMDTIQTVESHPAALGQCERFFAAHPHIRGVASDDTAGSVKRAIESGDATRAAIGGKRTASIYGGKIIREHIEDHNMNFTRFVLLSASGQPTQEGSKISLVVSLKNKPGALHGLLRPFVRRDIDLTKIESRPNKNDPEQFNFYLDLQAPARETELDSAMDEVKEMAESVRYLGRYPTMRLTNDKINEIS